MRPGDSDVFEQNIEDVEDQALQYDDGLQPDMPAAEPGVATSDQPQLLQDPLTAPAAASLLLAARVSRKRGWQVGWVGDAQDRIHGDIAELRKTQAERQFKVWRKH